MIFKWLTCRNIPHIHLHEKKANKEKWHGAEIQVVIEGNWTTYRVSSFDDPFAVPYFFRYFCVHKCLTRFIFSFPVKDLALHAPNGCYHSLCPVSI